MSTPNQIKVFKEVQKQVLKGGKISVTKAMRDSGAYSASTSKHAEKITKTKGFIKILEEAGLTDKFLAKKHNQLANSTRLENDNFYAEQVKEKKGKKKIVKWVHVSDEKIKLLIEGTEEDPTGIRVCYIKKFEKHKQVFFRVPDNIVQSKTLDMAYKIKDHFAPDKLNVITHEMSEDERGLFDSIFKNNK